MKKFEFAAACVLSGALVAGCSVAPTPSGPGSVEHASVDTSPSSDATTGRAPQANLDRLPAQLPPAVAKVASAIVRIEYMGTPAANSALITNGSYGSGVLIAPGRYLTAGHVLSNSNGQAYPGLGSCGQVRVDTPTRDPSPGNGLYGATLSDQKVVESYAPGDTTSTPDVGMVEAADTSGMRASQTPLPIAPRAPYLGELVFAMGYPASASGVARTPNQLALTTSQILEGYDKPVKYGGVIVGFQPNGDIIVGEGNKSYDRFGDDRNAAGESGGALLNDKGQLVAMTVEGSAIDTYTAAGLGSEWGSTVVGAVGHANLTYEVAQRVTDTLVRTLETDIAHTPSCTP